MRRSFDYNNDNEIEDCIYEYILEVCREISPLTRDEDNKSYASMKLKEFMRDMSHTVDKIRDEASCVIDAQASEIDNLKSEIAELKDLVKDLTSDLDDLRMRLDQPGKWYGKKFGL